MAEIGINFRETAGFVTDGTDEVGYVDTSSHSFNGFTYDWTTGGGINTRDRSTTPDRRMAGLHFQSSGGPIILTVTLPATGDYEIRSAHGDYSNDTGHESLNLKDNGTSFQSWDKPAGTTGANKWWDADGTTERASDAAWVSGNVAVNRTFGSTAFTMEVGDAGSLGSVAHLFVKQSAGGGGGGGIVRQMIEHGLFAHSGGRC